MYFDNIDGDGNPDLVIGAPGDYCCTPFEVPNPTAPFVGQVFVIPGTSTGLDPSAAFEITAPFDADFGPGSGFGASFAAGFIHEEIPTKTLLIGAPRAQDKGKSAPGKVDGGQVCQVFFGGTPAVGFPTNPSVGVGRCDSAPWRGPVFAQDGEKFQFGETLAAANVIPYDVLGVREQTTIHRRFYSGLDKIIVGAPFAEPARIVPGTTSYARDFISGAPPPGGYGTVTVFNGFLNTGLDWEVANPLTLTDVENVMLLQLQSNGTPSSTAGMGTALAVANLNQNSGLPDLVVGEPATAPGTSPAVGGVTWTRSVPRNGFATGVGGAWGTNDSGGAPRTVDVISDTGGDYTFVLHNFELAVRDGGGSTTGSLCTATGFSGTATLSTHLGGITIVDDPNPLDSNAWPTPAQTATLNDTSGDPLVRFWLDITHLNMGGNETISLTLRDAETYDKDDDLWTPLWPSDDCRPVTASGNGEFTLLMEVPNDCE